MALHQVWAPHFTGRSFDLAAPPRLPPGVCDDCADAISTGGAQFEETVAA